MTDRRSFSEIPTDMLRDNGAEPRVERVWERLEEDLAGGHRLRHGGPSGVAVGLSLLTFAVGVFVGMSWHGRGAAPLASLAAEPANVPHVVTAPAFGAPSPESASTAAPRLRGAHHVVASARRVDAVTEESPLPEPAEPAPVTGEWQRLADDGEYVQAWAALESNGGFDRALHEATADQLMALVDVARATGQRDRAVLALRRVVSEHGADPNAPVAAWMLGNELAKAHDLSSAEQAFAMYRALSPNGDFAEDALARQIDMAAELGNVDHAQRLAEQYLKEFPDGPRIADIQATLARAAHPAQPAPSGTPVREDAIPFAPDGGGLP